MARKFQISWPGRGKKKKQPAPPPEEELYTPAARSARKPRKPAPRTTRRKRKPAKKTGISDDLRLDIAGVLMFMGGLVLLLALFSPNNSGLMSVIINLIAQAFGIGRYGVPLFLAVIGGWILMRHFSERLPQIEPPRVMGALALYVALLVLFHVILAPISPEESIALAEAGQGGGLLGANILETLIAWFGYAGMWITLIAWALIAILLTLEISTQDIYNFAASLFTRLQTRREPPPVTEQHAWQPPLSSPVTQRSPLGDEEDEEDITPEPSGPVHPPLTPQAADAVTPAKKPRGRKPKTADTPAPVEPEPLIPASTSPYQQPIVIGGEQPWVLPDLTGILKEGMDTRADDEYDRHRVNTIEETLAAFGAPGRVVEVNRGPTITQFGVEPEYIEQRGGKRTKVKVSKIAGLADDLALALSAQSIRIEAPAPGRGYVGIEVPNTESVLVALRDVMESKAFQKIKSTLRLALGQDVSGQAVCADLTAMPHLLIAGTTGSGKSVCVNAIIATLLLTNTPDELKFLMVDPKRVELTTYRGLPHMLIDVVVDLERVVTSLQWVAREMDSRYTRFSKIGVRNIAEFNKKAKSNNEKKMPYLVVVIDELADLMMLAPEETEKIVTRLAQMARATGIHLIIATQRPSVDVVTGLIKANFPARISFAVASSVDSRVILDQPGAEKLLGRGDMLFLSPDIAQPIRMQGVFVSDDELNKLVRYWKGAYIDTAIDTTPSQPAATDTAQMPPASPIKSAASSPPPTTTPAAATTPQQTPLWDEIQSAVKKSEDDSGDDLLEDAIRVVREMRKASISLLQRRLRIGYTRSARLMDILEERGIVGPAKTGAQQREVLDYGEIEETTTYDQTGQP